VLWNSFDNLLQSLNLAIDLFALLFLDNGYGLSSDNFLSWLIHNSLDNLGVSLSNNLSVSDVDILDIDDLLLVDGDVLDDFFFFSWLSLDLLLPLDDFSSPLINLLVDVFLAILDDLVLHDLLLDDLSLLLWSLLELLSELDNLFDVLFDDFLVWSFDNFLVNKWSSSVSLWSPGSLSSSDSLSSDDEL